MTTATHAPFAVRQKPPFRADHVGSYLRPARLQEARRKFFAGGSVPESGGLDDIVWLRNTGEQMSDEDWASGFARTVGVFLNGRGIPSPDPRGRRVIDDSFMLCFNAHWEDVPFTLPPEDYGQSWEAVVNTAAPLAEFAVERSFKPLDVVDVDARAVLVLRRVF